MVRTRTPGGAPGWLWVNLAAMGFSLVHTVADAGIVFGASSSSSEVQQSFATLTVLIGLVYTWWAWVFARAVGGANSGLVGLMAFDVLWVGLNGLSIIYCLPPCGSVPLYGDTLHLGTLILGPLAAYFAYRAMRRSSSVRGSRLAMAGNVVIMVALLVAILAVLARLANTAGGF